MSDTHKFQVGEWVALFSDYHHGGTTPLIKAISAITPTGRIRIEKTYFKAGTNGSAWQIGGDVWHRTHFKRLTPELEEQALRHKMTETIKATHYGKFSTEDLKAVYNAILSAKQGSLAGGGE